MSTLDGLKLKLAEAIKKGNKEHIKAYKKAIKTQEFWG